MTGFSAEAYPETALSRRRAPQRFGRPDDVATAALSRRRRLQILEDWTQQLADDDIVASEGGRRLESDRHLLAELAAAVARVEAEAGRAIGVAGLWRRLTAG